MTYFRNLLEAGWDGFVSGQWKRANAQALLTPALIGAGIGALAGAVVKERRSRQRIVMAGAIGSAAGIAWASRLPATAAARAAIRNVNTVRDAHWLEKHPIAYA